MKRYDSSQVVRVVLMPAQKAWLQAQSRDFRSMSQVVRDLIDQAMAEGSK
jgi:hypothetical protein